MIMDIPAIILTTLMVNYGVLPVFYENNITNCYSVWIRIGYVRDVRPSFV